MLIWIDRLTMSFVTKRTKDTVEGPAEANRTYSRFSDAELRRLYYGRTGCHYCGADYNAVVQICKVLGKIYLEEIRTMRVQIEDPSLASQFGSGIQVEVVPKAATKPLVAAPVLDYFVPCPTSPTERIPMPKKKTAVGQAVNVAMAAPAGSPTAAAAAVAVAVAAKPPKDTRNGVTRPSADSVTGSIWVAADNISAKKESPAARAEVFEALKPLNLNESTVATQYGKWRRYYGLKKPEKAPTEEAAVTEAPVTGVPADDEAAVEDEAEASE